MIAILPILLSSALVISAICDLRLHKVPNVVTYPTMMIGIAYHVGTRGLDGLFFGLGGLFAGLGLLIIPYLMGGMGAGDVKLLAAVGAFTGPLGVFYSFLYTALAGGLYAIAVMIVNRGSFKGFFKRQYQSLVVFALTREFILRPSAVGEKPPRLYYGIAIAIGSGVYLASSYYR